MFLSPRRCESLSSEFGHEETPVSESHQCVAHQPEDQQAPMELLQSPRRGEAGEGCSKVWIVTLGSSSYLSSPGVGLQALGSGDPWAQLRV